MKFKTKHSYIYDDDSRVYSESGSPEAIKYSSRYAKDGSIEVYEVGKKNTQEYIESWADSCDLNKMIARYMAGDETALNRVKGEFLDLTSMPTSFADMFNLVRDAEDNFAALPVEVKEKFNNNAVEYYMQYGSDSFVEKIKSVMKVSADDVKVIVEEKGVEVDA